MIEILAEAGADGAFLDDGERRRQRAGAQQDGEIVGALDGEIAGDLPRAAENGLANDRRGDHLVVEHDGERLADVRSRRLGELARAGRIETEADDRFAVALIEAGLGVDQIAAGDEHALLDQELLAAFALENFQIRRRMGLGRLFRAHGLVDHAEVELGGLAEHFLEARRILQAGDLHENARDAFALDRRLDQAELVDAALDDLNRLIDRLADALGDSRVGGGERDDAGVLGDVDAALSGGAEDAGQWLRQLTQLFDRGGDVAVARDANIDAVAMDGAPGEGDARLAQRAQHVVGDSLQPLLAHRVGVDLEQEARAALQVQTEHDVALRPCRPGPHRRVGEEARHRTQAHEERREHDGRRLPAREKQHG